MRSRWPEERGSRAAWSLFCLAHLAFHVTHLDGMGTEAAVTQTAGLVVVLAPPVVAVVVLRPARRGGSA